MQGILVLLAVEDSLQRDSLAKLIQSDRDLNAQIKYCDPKDVLKVAYNRNPNAVIIDREDNALPGPCTHLLDQVPNLGIVVTSRRHNCPPLCYRQVICVEELEDSGPALLRALRCLGK